MSPPPVYLHPPRKVGDRHIRRAGVAALIENVFFGVAALLAVVFAFVVLRTGLSSWTHAAYVLVFWGVLAYLALPRIHRVLTALYVPDYFFGRARTSDGLLGDPVNLAVNGSEAQIHAAMRRAGWVQADPIDLRSSLRIVRASLTRRSYPEAPVSPLLLFGRVQRFAYQKEVKGNPAQRHHVRFWPCPEGWLLPGGHSVGWLAAGTYDRSIGLSLFTLQVTHKIDQDIDVERDFIIDTVQHSLPEASVRLIKDFSTGYHSRNGGGDRVTTDGDLPILELDSVALPAGEEPAALEPASTAGAMVPAAAPHASTDGRGDAGRRPVSVMAAIALLVLSSLISVGSSVIAVREEMHEPFADGDVSGVVLAMTAAVTLVVVYVLLGLIAWRMYAGGRSARLGLIGMLAVTQISQLARYVGSDRPTFVTLLSMTIDLLTLYALTSRSARDWTDARVRRAPA